MSTFDHPPRLVLFLVCKKLYGGSKKLLFLVLTAFPLIVFLTTRDGLSPPVGMVVSVALLPFTVLILHPRTLALIDHDNPLCCFTKNSPLIEASCYFCSFSCLAAC
ncbi:hypothetical protein K402DRAFT_55622 [Aulographum hederae CBS 113979]|uniref:Uncharacterized protein n=1 Tax=Aulographum hederae CBS 113979 TaxID=1176131 RepID=A0A6G1H255_9PEZI|nr:hypothetical protein K402DRAFT_55622 [Aulographum hederae CBS 113979]